MLEFFGRIPPNMQLWKVTIHGVTTARMVFQNEVSQKMLLAGC